LENVELLTLETGQWWGHQWPNQPSQKTITMTTICDIYVSRQGVRRTRTYWSQTQDSEDNGTM